jgi:fatty-acyl-CoA synthase
MSDPGNRPRTVGDLVLARVDDDHPAILFEGRTWSWAEVVDEAARRATVLAALRTDGPFHVGVLLDNVPEHVFAFAAAALAGATVVGINPTRRGEHLARDVRHTDCQLILTDREHRPMLDGLDLGLDDDRILETDRADYASRLPATAAPDTVLCDPDDLYVLIFTSGSAGAPKAVRMTHGRAVRASDSLLCTRDDVPYCAMPLFHGNALNACLLPALRVGATMALKRRFSASDFIGDIRAGGCTYFSAIGRVLNYVLATPERPDDRDNSLKLVLGPESSPADIQEFERRFGCPVFAGYGSSENAVILMPARTADGAMGVAPPGDDVVVVNPETAEVCDTARFDEHGKLLNADEAIGEIVGRNVLGRFEGYYNDPDAEIDRRRNGWYWSGDLAYRDADGVFWFAGRTADWIRVDGENFGTAPIERILQRFPTVGSVAVYGVPDERNAEDQVMAAIEPAGGAAFDPVAFTDFLAAQPDLGPKWIPRFVRIVDRLPVTGTEKVDKKPLRREAWSTTDPVWWRADRRDAEFRPLAVPDARSLSETLMTNRRLTVGATVPPSGR